MNAEVIKAMNQKKETGVYNIRRWWKANGYKILRVILFPVWIASMLADKYNQYRDAQQTWSDERSTEILNYYIPRVADWDEKNQSFYFVDSGMGWGHCIDKIKRRDRRYWKVHCGWWGGKMRDFLIDSFELEGFTKDVGWCDDGWTDITFDLNSVEG